MGTTTSAIFTGSSQFSNDFQQAISRAVSIASLPTQSLQTDVTHLTSQSTELGTLNTKLGSLQTAIANLGSALGQGSYTASSSTPATASVALTGAPSPGSFSIEVAGVGAYASATSGIAGVTDPTKSSVSSAGSYLLTVGTASFTITPQANTLSALAAAINSTSGANVQATLVNFGSTSSPDYRISLQGTKLGDLPIQLSANGTNPDGTTSETPLLNTGVTGAPVTYRINGHPASPADPLTSDSHTITASPGVSVTLLAPGTTTITVGQNTNAVSSALTGLVTAYNAVTAEINTNRGTGTGALKGQSILSTLTRALQEISGYSTGNSGISSLTSLGLTFDDKGVLSFNSTTFSAATSGNLTQLASFLGSTSTGGFLKAANDTLTGLTNLDTGTVEAGIAAVQTQIARDNQSISDQQNRITALQNNLNQQMAAADAAIAAMEQQYSYFSNMFTAMQINARNGG